MAYATDESASDDSTASALILVRRSCDGCCVASGTPSRTVRSRARKRAKSPVGVVARRVTSSQPGALSSNPWVFERTTRT